MDIRKKLVELLGSLTTVQVFCDMDGDPVSRLVSRVVAEEDVDGLADHLIANGVTVQEWIPVSDPPEEPGEYIVSIKGGASSTTLYYSEEFWFEEDDEGWRTFHPVTHWMPLPQLPKGE